MSDIKIEHIIAAEEDNGEHTRFPFLAVVRYAAAAGVTMLTLAVIAMVIHAVLRSENIRLSVNGGYIGADKLWSETYVSRSETTSGANAEEGKLANLQSTATATSRVIQQPVIRIDVPVEHPEPVIGVGEGGVGGGDGVGTSDDAPYENPMGTSYGDNGATQVTLQQAHKTNLRVTLIANNPGGRTKIDCNDTTVSIIDMRFPTRYEIGKLELGSFTVQPQTTITLQKRLKITDKAKLGYIWDHYGGQDSFGVVVWVSASVTSYPLGKKTQTEMLTYVCPLVTLGLIDRERYLATGDAECKPRNTLASAPAPAPVPARRSSDYALQIQAAGGQLPS